MSDGEPCNGTAKSHADPPVMENFRRKLKYYFMSPCQKYRARGRKPWKMILQILKIAIITIQYLHLQDLSVDNHAFEKIDDMFTPLSLCQELYRHANISPATETFDIDPHVETECISIYPISPYKNGDLENDMNLTLDFQRLLAVKIYFKIKAINVQTVRHQELPDCYDFNINIIFDNIAHSGKIKISLSSDVQIKGCKDWNVSDSNSHFRLIVLFDCVVICSCLLSLVLCTRSVCTGLLLQLEYTTFVSIHHNKTVSWSERMEFINGWYILVIISDTLSIAGSILKICIQSKELTNYDVCSILLGTATMLVWIGVMRYLSFFQKYYILILTLQAALPSAIRFSICAVMIYLSYCFCGWIVLGPHHENFRTFNLVADCLFSMINGDEVYSSFKKLRDKTYVVWLFSRIYIYSFISLFTFMVLSLFIAIITDTYETIKHCQTRAEPRSELWAFLAECRDTPDSGKYMMDEEESSSSSSCCCYCCLCCS
ncbi:mucolipin-3 isoform X4 [Siphateles boraxobius]|uniref:mucolipin-3 isoform X4 n=1 Tax=Siphateles boraxobius TaxID=180520 RepID=UPI00406455BE